jgi:hypothetical protein
LSSKPAHLITLRPIFHFPNYTNIRFYMYIFSFFTHVLSTRFPSDTLLRLSLAKWLTSLPAAFTHIKLVNGADRLHINKIFKFYNWKTLVRTQHWFCTRIFHLKFFTFDFRIFILRQVPFHSYSGKTSLIISDGRPCVKMLSKLLTQLAPHLGEIIF